MSSDLTRKLVFGTGGRFGRLSEKEASDLVGFAFSNGIDKFDTGTQYCRGRSQSLLFKSLSVQGVSRSKFTVCSKISPELLLDTNASDIKSLLLSGCVDELRYLDVLMLWGPSIKHLENPRLLDRLVRLREDGVIRKIGVNTHHSNVMNFVLDEPSLGCVNDLMLDFNILQASRSVIVDSFKASSVSRSVWAGTALCQGFLVQSLLTMYLRSRSISYLARALLNPPTRLYLSRSSSVRCLLKERFGSAWNKVPLSFVLQNPAVSYVPLGMLSRSSISKNIDAATRPVDASAIDLFVSELPSHLFLHDVFK